MWAVCCFAYQPVTPWAGVQAHKSYSASEQLEGNQSVKQHPKMWTG